MVRDCARIWAGVLTFRLYLQQRQLLGFRRLRRGDLAGVAGLADPDPVPARRRPYPVAHVPLVVLRRVGAAAEELPVAPYQIGPLLAEPPQVPLPRPRPQVQRDRRGT